MAHRPSWLPALVAALVAVAIYAGAALQAGYVHDDHPAVVANDLVAWPPDLGAIWTSPWFGSRPAFAHQGLSRPLATLSFALEIRLGLDSPAGRHLVQLGLYALLCAAFVHLVVRLLLAAGRSPRQAQLAALVAGAAFAALPVHAEVVVALAYRPEILALLFTTAATGRLLALRQGHGGPAAVAVAALCLLAALWSKESALAALLAWTAWGLSSPPARARLLRPLGLLWLVGLGWLLWRRLTLGTVLADAVPYADNPLVAEPAPLRVLNALDLAARATRHLLWPLRPDGDTILAPDYTFAAWPVARAPSLLTLIGLLVLAGLVLVAARATWRLHRPPPPARAVPAEAVPAEPAPLPDDELVVLAATAGLAAWLPVSQLLFPSTVLFADRLLFAPSWALALGLALLLARLPVDAARARLLVVAASAALVAAWGQGAQATAADWTTELRLFRRGVDRQPGSARMRYDLARLELQTGDPRAGWPHLLAAAALQPEDPDVLTLGLETAGRAGQCDDGATFAATLARLPRRPALARLAAAQWGLDCRRFTDAWALARTLRPRAVPPPWPQRVLTLAVAAGDEEGARRWVQGFGADLDTTPAFVAAAAQGDELADRPVAALRRLIALQQARPGLPGLDSAARALYERHAAHPDAAALRALLQVAWPDAARPPAR